MAPRAKTVLFFFAFAVVFASGQYVLDDSVGLGRKFDGIGGLSAGASSRLLSNYPQEQLGQILDYLFKPNFGAALQILKVEIGGDAQSTDGTESSHMHSRDEENYQTGYEWMLMVEAKKRNPNIKLYGLSWGFPAWVGNGSGSPYKFPNQTAEYVVKWVLGAKKYYNLDIDYVGIWNERSYDSTYIKVLRHLLDENGLQHTRIVAHDGGWDIAGDILKDPDLANAVDIIGAHYPGTTSSSDAAMTGKQLWASEDYSTYNDLTGGGCWARLLNQNYINGNMTSTITWNLIASYYSGLPFYRDGLMTAAHPWTGHYDVESPIWGSAHTTQFTQLGWSYLKHGYGVGHLEKGGSYVTLISPDKKDCTIVIETMSHDHSVCVRPRLPPYSVANQTANFELKGSLANIKILHMWRTHHDFTGNGTNYFEQTSDIEVARGKFTISLDVDSIWTLSTTTGQKKGNYSNVPNPAPFPVPYHDDFDSYAEYSEAANFADQSGVFEIYDTKSSHGKVMRQVVLERPITWCNDANQPISLLGDQSWQDVNVSVEGMVEKNTSVFVAARVHTGGCGIAGTDGFFLWLSSDGPFTITSDLAGKKVLSKGDGHGKAGQWFTLFIHVLKQTAIAMINGEIVYQTDSFTGSSSGWAAIGTSSFDYAQFDNFYVNSSALPCLSQPSAGQSVVMSARSTIKMWQMNADGTIQLVNTSFCLDVSGKTSAGGLNVVIEKCQSGSSTQTYLYEKARMLLKLKQSNNCLEIMNMDTSEGAEVELWPCNGANQQWLIPSGPGLINIQLDNTYLAVCH
ncbi:galactocerebrosidase-like isoform X2 [Corticium candelabrum]|uniref:galactocerebrosidase-like isoform X2 n=1 Tax=Corticium candelabrum TaxID=121492 RepID=UPI002E2632BE|nr:galactocerebrosidase-like isoform X2 [Corticium candelabrum]